MRRFLFLFVLALVFSTCYACASSQSSNKGIAPEFPIVYIDPLQGVEGTGVIFWYNRRPIQNVPVHWKSLYEAAEKCIRWKGDYNRVVWQYADSIYFSSNVADTIWNKTPSIAHAAGVIDRARAMWIPPDTVVVDSLIGTGPSTIMHESNHDIIGGGGHPAVLFNACT